MEHRNGSRFPIKLKLEVWQGDRPRGQFITRNLGQGGVFIGDCEFKSSAGELLTLKISKASQPGAQDRFLKALVVHQSKHGIGLMWFNNGPDFLANYSI